MLISIALIMFSGLFAGWLYRKIRFPALFGMIPAGILIAPHMLGLLDENILNIPAEIRRIALIIILIRAGLKLNLSDLKKVGRPAVLLCFVPACFEIFSMVLLAPRILGLSVLDSAILGAVIGAVSPAVVVSKMIKLIDEGYGIDKGIPQMILAGASVDDVFVIVMFTSFTGLAKGEDVSCVNFLNIPFSVTIGILVGIGVGLLYVAIFSRLHIDTAVQAVLFISVAFVLNFIEDAFPMIPFAGLLAIMAAGSAIRKKNGNIAASLSAVFDKL